MLELDDFEYAVLLGIYEFSAQGAEAECPN